MARMKRAPTHVELKKIAPVCSIVVPYQSRQLVVSAVGNKSPALQVQPLRMKVKRVFGRGPQRGQDAN